MDQSTISFIKEELKVIIPLLYSIWLLYRFFRIRAILKELEIEVINDAVFDILKISTDRVKRLIVGTRWDNDLFLVSYKNILYSSLMVNTVRRIRRTIAQARVINIKGKSREDFIKKIGARLRHKNQFEMEELAGSMAEFISETHEQRFTEEEAIAKLREIMDRVEDMRRQQWKELARSMVFLKSLYGK